MREIYLGDSYDIVKRFWCQGQSKIAPLYAHPRFVPQAIRAKNMEATRIPVLESTPQDSLGLLLDPSTGIPLPNEPVHHPTNSHAPLPFIVQLNEALHPTYIICFDQTYHRIPGLSRQEQRSTKLQFLSKRRLCPVYSVPMCRFGSQHRVWKH